MDQTRAGIPFLLDWATQGDTTVSKLGVGCWSFTLQHKKINKYFTSLDYYYDHASMLNWLVSNDFPLGC